VDVTLVRTALATATAALVPARCAGCDAPGAWLCGDCRDGLDPHTIRTGSTEIRGAGAHDGPLRHAIHRFKYRAESGLAAELGGLVADLLVADIARGHRCDALVPVPLHPERARSRGYDQTALLAGSIAGATGLPVLPAIRRIRNARPQVDLDRAERSRNVDGAFVGCAGSLAGLRIAVIDDVATTGSTCAAVASSARACGAGSVRAYVVAIDE
jgi:competence protein ComFC